MSVWNPLITECAERVLNGGEITFDEAVALIELSDEQSLEFFAAADKIRRTFMGQAMDLCAIVNAKSGNCSEDCAFCSQSKVSRAAIAEYNYMPVEQVAEKAQEAYAMGARAFGIVTSGWGLRSQSQMETLKGYLGAIKVKSDIGRCASLGPLTHGQAKELAEAGLQRYHHNIETAPSHFDAICSTHTFQENLTTLEAAAAAGMSVCAGGIVGMGESPRQRVEMAFTLKPYPIASIPINFLNAIEGTTLHDRGVQNLTPFEMLRTVAVFRFIHPKADIRIAGGRHLLGELQPLLFMAGGSAAMVGNYLTTNGLNPEDDERMFQHLGRPPLEVARGL
ncbi:MAG: biotin synthase BioB [Alphaproteobacteria bacterium CG_4_10_14_0_2_um_filter_63_37]|nr:MAG: biotin synthase BioB [Proteobacteria bacterium CG1_02_64_396]PJA24274.1 MAG: biotin synthase BioB [Alphaproteobacteria bacterium CG_4_10_14_0_2_um_filter_63_37]